MLISPLRFGDWAGELRMMKKRLNGQGRRNSGATDPPAIPVDIWNLAVLLEAQRYAFPAEVWDIGLDCAAEHFCLSDCAAVDFTDHRSAISRERSALGTRTIAYYADSSAMDHGGRATVLGVLSRVSDYRCVYLCDRIRAGTKRGLDFAHSGAAAAILLPAANVHSAVPLGEGSGERAPCWVERCRAGTSSASAGASHAVGSFYTPKFVAKISGRGWSLWPERDHRLVEERTRAGRRGTGGVDFFICPNRG